MANVNNHLERIRTAIYGEEVRGSIHDAIDAINKESSGMNTQALEALKKAQSLATEADSSLKSFQYSLDVVQKAEQDIMKKVSDLMKKRIYDDVLDSSGGNVKDSSGNNIMGSAVFPDASDVENLKRSLEALETVCRSFSKEYQNHILSQDEINSENAEKFDDLFEAKDELLEAKDNLITGQTVTNELLDSSGGNVLDSSGNYILGSAVIPNQSAVNDLDARLKALESDHQTHVKLQSGINFENEEILSDFTDMKHNLAVGCWFSDNLLDSSGNQIRDSTDGDVAGQTVLADRAMVDSLSSRVAAIEIILSNITKHAVFDSY